MKVRIVWLCLLTIGLCCLPVVAQNDLYNDGPTNGTTDAWTINLGFSIADSFTLSSNSTVNGLNFAVWLQPGDVLQSVEITLSSEPFNGQSFFDEQVNVTQSGCTLNQYGFDVCTEAASFSGVALNAGNYWLTLQNGVVNTGDPVYWDENSGPSSAASSYLGTIPAESFTMLGHSGSGTSTTPEPDTVLLFVSGLFGVGALLRRNLL